LLLSVTPAHGQGSAANQAAPPRLYRTYGKKASEVYKNIQVLKDIDCTELIPTMRYMADSLGVGCDFCHVASGSDKDEKKTKLEARKMIRMTWEINRNHFNGEKVVSCTVCHRGAESPVFYPAIAEEGSEPAAASQPPANRPTADRILAKYLTAVGGARAVERISTRVEKGTFISGDRKWPYEVYAEAPNKRVAVTHQPAGDTIEAFDGTSAWIEITAPSPPGRDLTPSETAAAKLDADLKLALDAGQILQGLRVLPPEKIGGKEMYVVSGKPEGMRDVRLYFDEQTGFLTRVLRYTEVPLGFTPVEIDYADYREVDGVKIPFRWAVALPSGRSMVQIDTVQQNVAMDETKFRRPSAAPGRQ
jgi:photosynthetic reaction center cytochrome c subunit